MVKREQPLNPAGFLATQDLKDRGWTPALIARFLGEHDSTRPNGLKMGRRRLPPVKLYREERIYEAERDDTFLAAQAKAADARERAERARATRQAKREALLYAAAAQYTPSINPEKLRKGATRKAREPYLKGLEREQKRLEREIGKVTERESLRLRELLQERLDEALAAVYDWFPSPQQAKEKQAVKGSGEAKPSDWREWEWD